MLSTANLWFASERNKVSKVQISFLCYSAPKQKLFKNHKYPKYYSS